MEAIVEAIVEKTAEQIAEKVIDHLKDNLEVIIPAGTYIQTVSGGSGSPAVGTPNVLPFTIEKPNIK